jgi:long-chain acyl-CoA synthetase
MTGRTVIPAVFADAARKFAARPCVFEKTDAGWEMLTFRDVYERAQYFAAWLLRRGFTKQDRLVLAAETGPEWVTALFGAFFAGLSVAPLSTRLLPDELFYRLNHCEARIAVVSRGMLEKIAAPWESSGLRLSFVYFDGNGADSGEAPRHFPESRITAFSECLAGGKKNFSAPELSRVESGISGEDEALICYTPGTEGGPKAVRLSHTNFLALSPDAARLFTAPRMLKTLAAAPRNYSCIHIAGLPFTLFRGVPLFFSDAPEELADHLRPLPLGLHYPSPIFFLVEIQALENLKKKIIRDIEKRGKLTRSLFRLGVRAGEVYFGDGFNRPPYFVRLRSWFPYYLANRFVFSRIRRSFGCRLRFFAGGTGWLPFRDQVFFYVLGLPVFQTYALTEASPLISSNTMAVHKFGTSGRILPGVSCRIVNSGGYPAGIGEAGEICIQGQPVMKGYLKNEEATQNALRNDWLYTGDMGYVDEDGFLVVTGRKNTLLVSPGGEKFSPEIIEEAICSSSPLVRQVLVYNNRRKYSAALVVLDETRLKALAEKNGLTDPREILDAVIESFYAFKNNPCRKIPGLWRPATFRILAGGFTERNGMLNSAKKIVRHRIIETCKKILESMYTAEGDSPRCEANLDVLWKLIQKTPGAET